ncbi:tRNA (adenine(58)-N(1))-methyltransferase catalytic subunit TRMT61A-like [Centruroides sculpturatus]|uniref:tRNA (adenine(58)-N(1))-methyltransferase catalytic subunit TRMT61A-like n=1 Tax=Centruroides sculpturatus TaxID=218467 RepID=UPI000C6DEC26|nr:tRNA (adenine(58)-N(1))-methyltransferase catalytic subunit TRMT61A-like [Centruroides sculpturatus]
MSFLKRKEFVEEGDTVIVYLSVQNIYSIRTSKGKVFQTKYGALKHDDVIGSRYGCRVNCTRGWVYVLFPTPELWTVTLPHRTQILYTPDISLIVLGLDLKPGSVVYEAGTGSGSLSHAIARTIAPNGHLYTFDFHEQRVNMAKEEFDAHGLSEIISVSQRDVCTDGFDVLEKADAVFLDLPRPWEAMTSLRNIMKSSGSRLCSFSPCIEQVQKTCRRLDRLGFSDVTTAECLLRPYEVKRVSMPVFQPSQDVIEDVAGGSEQSSGEEATAKKSKHCLPRSRGGDGTTTANFWSALPTSQITGHTGYLTFATLYPGS